MLLKEFTLNNNTYKWFLINEDNEWFYWTSDYTLSDNFNIEVYISKLEDGLKLFCIDSKKYSYLYIDENTFKEYDDAGLFESNGYEYNRLDFMKIALIIADYYTRYILDIQ